MTTATLLPMARAVFSDANGAPLAGGFVATYVPGGTTPKATWQDAAASIPNQNPVPLDSNGSCLLYGEGTYQLTVTDADGNAVPAYSGVTASSDWLTINGAALTFPPGAGASNERWIGGGATNTTVNGPTWVTLAVANATIMQATATAVQITAPNLQPVADNATACGAPGQRWAAVYAARLFVATVNGGGSALGNFANDVAAAAGGVAIGQIYANGSVVMIRQS